MDLRLSTNRLNIFQETEKLILLGTDFGQDFYEELGSPELQQVQVEGYLAPANVEVDWWLFTRAETLLATGIRPVTAEDFDNVCTGTG